MNVTRMPYCILNILNRDKNINSFMTEDGQLVNDLRNILDSAITHFIREKSKDNVIWSILNLIFVKRLIQTFSLNHQKRFGFNDFKVLEY